VGALVRLVSDGDFPPEGFRSGGGFEVLTVEIDIGALGVVVNQPSTRYVLCVQDREMMVWVLVEGQLLEVPNVHLRRLT
jgi:hypothetical protein